jgi:hypothetical protein
MTSLLLLIRRLFVGFEVDSVLTVERQTYGVDAIYSDGERVHVVPLCAASFETAHPVDVRRARGLENCEHCLPDPPGLLTFDKEGISRAEMVNRTTEFYRARAIRVEQERMVRERIVAPNLDPGLIARIRQAEATLNELPLDLRGLTDQQAQAQAHRLETEVAKMLRAAEEEWDRELRDGPRKDHR